MRSTIQGYQLSTKYSGEDISKILILIIWPLRFVYVQLYFCTISPYSVFTVHIPSHTYNNGKRKKKDRCYIHFTKNSFIALDSRSIKLSSQNSNFFDAAFDFDKSIWSDQYKCSIWVGWKWKNSAIRSCMISSCTITSKAKINIFWKKILHSIKLGAAPFRLSFEANSYLQGYIW